MTVSETSADKNLSMHHDMKMFGWNEELTALWDKNANENCIPGRVIADYGQSLKVAAPQELNVAISGRMEYLRKSSEMPKVGDWVAVQLIDDGHGIIHEVLERKSEISRKQAGERFERQVLAANIDIAFLVQALDFDFSPERLRRYMFQLQKENIMPVLVLNKSDRAEELSSKLDELRSFDCKILITSALEGTGMEDIAAMIGRGETAVFLGSSGVGKSTITNSLIGEHRQATRATREEDSKGRHTTTHRELFVLPNGGLIVDTPGLRELQLWGTEKDLNEIYPEIDALARRCKFSNCTHSSETGCAIQKALADHTLDNNVYGLYLKFQKELRYLNTKVDVNAAQERKHNNKKIQKDYRKHVKSKYKK